MLKLVILLSALAALAVTASSKLQTTPEELNLVWNTIDEDLQMRQFTAAAEIRTLIPPMQDLVIDAQTILFQDIKKAAESYTDGVSQLEQEYSDIATCVLAAEKKLSDYNASLVQLYGALFIKLYEEAQEDIELALQITVRTLDEVSEVRKLVQACADEACATKLDFQVVVLRDRVVKRLDDAIQQATDASLVKLPADLTAHRLNVERYETFTNRLLVEIKQCATS